MSVRRTKEKAQAEDSSHSKAMEARDERSRRLRKTNREIGTQPAASRTASFFAVTRAIRFLDSVQGMIFCLDFQRFPVYAEFVRAVVCS